jgi:hypothetical protein
MSFRRQFPTLTQRLTYIAVCSFALSQYVLIHNPWQTIFRAAGVIAILSALTILFTGRMHKGNSDHATG